MFTADGNVNSIENNVTIDSNGYLYKFSGDEIKEIALHGTWNDMARLPEGEQRNAYIGHSHFILDSSDNSVRITNDRIEVGSNYTKIATLTIDADSITIVKDEYDSQLSIDYQAISVKNGLSTNVFACDGTYYDMNKKLDADATITESEINKLF